MTHEDAVRLDERVREVLAQLHVAPSDVLPGVCIDPARFQGSGATIESRNPANERLLGRVQLASSEDLDEALAGAAQAAHA